MLKDRLHPRDDLIKSSDCGSQVNKECRLRGVLPRPHAHGHIMAPWYFLIVCSCITPLIELYRVILFNCVSKFFKMRHTEDFSDRFIKMCHCFSRRISIFQCHKEPHYSMEPIGFVCNCTGHAQTALLSSWLEENLSSITQKHLLYLNVAHKLKPLL